MTTETKLVTSTYIPSSEEFIHEGVLLQKTTNPETMKRVDNFQFQDSDIILTTFPRNGTTLTQEIVWQIMNKDTIVRGELYGDIDPRFPFLELGHPVENKLCVDRLIECTPPVNPNARLIKTHMPLRYTRSKLANLKSKIIIVIRNPKDACVSYFHFYKGMSLFGPWSGDWDMFVDMYLEGNTSWGSWFDWNLEWWNEGGQKWGVTKSKSHDWPMLVLCYEDLLASPAQQVSIIAEYLGVTLTTQQLETVLFNSKFDTMLANTAINFTDEETGFTFLRRGQMGDWRKHFSAAQNEKFDLVIENKLKNSGLHFNYGVD